MCEKLSIFPPTTKTEKEGKKKIALHSNPAWSGPAHPVQHRDQNQVV